MDAVVAVAAVADGSVTCLQERGVPLVPDRVGIGWRPELAAAILANLDRIDVVEVMAEDLFPLSKGDLLSFRTLGNEVALVLHGVSLGPASAVAVDPRRLDKLARVVGIVEPQFWSEHLAFVRSRDREIGHLAAPPRTEATVDGTACNIHRAHAVVGMKPLVENIATLIDPPASDRDEATWITQIHVASGCRLLLDLNNLHTNAVNFRYDALASLADIPLDQVGAVHLAGGRWMAAPGGERRLLDDHLHDVPEVVYDLLAEVAARTSHPLTVILERDGAFPPFATLLTQMDRARVALARGRLAAAKPNFSTWLTSGVA